MPAQDRTGPLGAGPLTGRGLGPCGAGFRRGFARFGRGFGRAIPLASPIVQESVVLTEAEEKQILQDELKQMKAEMQEIQKRLKELK